MICLQDRYVLRLTWLSSSLLLSLLSLYIIEKRESMCNISLSFNIIKFLVSIYCE